jgi:predicted nucleic acid-binding Zn ribbon protein
LKKDHPEHIGSIIKDLFDNPHWQRHREISLPLLRWPDIVGAKIAGQSQPESLQNGVLTVGVENPAWLHHLRFLRGELLQRLDKQLPSSNIKEVRFRQGPLDRIEAPPTSTNSARNAHSQRGSQPSRPLSSHQIKLLQSVPDPELRRDLEGLLKRQRDRYGT